MPLIHAFADGNVHVIGLADMLRATRESRPHRFNGDLVFHVLEMIEVFQRPSGTGHAVAIEIRCERPAPRPADSQIEVRT